MPNKFESQHDIMMYKRDSLAWSFWSPNRQLKIDKITEYQPEPFEEQGLRGKFQGRMKQKKKK